MNDVATRTLHFGDGFDVPIDAALARFVILGKSGCGKSNAEAVMIEELVRAGIPVWQLDPLGNAWGIRAGRDGESPGLPIVIFGGTHADAPLGNADKICSIVAGERISALMDLSELDVDAQREFASEFCMTLLDVARSTDLVGHLFLSEADRFAPNTVGYKDQVKRWARTIRNFSIGWTFTTQRPQILAPDVVESANVIVAMKIPTGLAKDSIEGKIAGAFDTRAQLKTALEHLPRMERGDALFVPDSDWIEDDEWLPGRVHFRRCDTFDSRKPRRIGEALREVKLLADVDLSKIREALAIVDEPDGAGDEDLRVTELRSRVAELEEQLAILQTSAAPPVDLDRAREVGEYLLQVADKLGSQLVNAFVTSAEVEPHFAELAAIGSEISAAIDAAECGKVQRGVAPSSTVRDAPIRTSAHPVRADGATSSLPRAERLILTALAQHRKPLRDAQIAILAGYAANGGGFRNALGSLKGKGYITAVGPRIYEILAEGRDALGPVTPLPTGRALLEHWCGELPKAESLALRAIAGVYPKRISVEDVAREAGYEATGGGFRNALGRLRTLQLVDGRGELRASDALFDRTGRL